MYVLEIRFIVLFLLEISSNHKWDSCEELYHWLGKSGNEDADYVTLFKKSILKRYQLSDITEEILKKYGIENDDDRQAIFEKIEKLKKKPK
jgi:hypothetical protein